MATNFTACAPLRLRRRWALMLIALGFGLQQAAADSTVRIVGVDQEPKAAAPPNVAQVGEPAAPLSLHHYRLATRMPLRSSEPVALETARPDLSSFQFVTLMADRQSIASQAARELSDNPSTTPVVAAAGPKPQVTVANDPTAHDDSNYRFVPLWVQRHVPALHGIEEPAGTATETPDVPLFASRGLTGNTPAHDLISVDAYSSFDACRELPGLGPIAVSYPDPLVGPTQVLDAAPLVVTAPCGPAAAPVLGCPFYPTQSGAHTICGVDCGPPCAPCCSTWHDARPIPWSLFGPGEYVGPPRPEHVPTYYLRVNDLLTITYIASRQRSPERYRVGVGDRLRIESVTDPNLLRDVDVQPDGHITLPLIGDVPAAGKTVNELRDDLVARFGQIEEEPIITVTPVEFNVALREIINAVTTQTRLSGQAIDLRVTPEGTIQVPGIGSVYVQGLTLEELRHELEARYAAMFGVGLLLSPALSERATTFVFIGGEVRQPGRYTLEGPTTVMQAIALAGGWNVGANNRHVVVFRRDENWCLKATRINVHGPMYGKDPCPVNDVWLRDNDLVIVPKSRVLCAADVIELYFTRGIYAVFPVTFVRDLSRGSTIVPIP